MLITENDDSLVFRWVTLNSYGQIFYENSKTFVKPTQYCNLDRETTSEDDADFWLEQINETERYLVPRGAALFSISGTKAPIQTGSQDFEFMVDKGNASQSYWTFDCFAAAGTKIVGFLQTNTRAGGFTSDWYLQIVDPNGNITRSWFGKQNFSSLTELNFEYEVSSPGFYKVRVINVSSDALKVYLKIEPGSWIFYEAGRAFDSWKIVKLE
jgi:hypothetical protein